MNQTIQKARDLIVKDFCKHAYRRKVGHTSQYCAIGAVLESLPNKDEIVLWEPDPWNRDNTEDRPFFKGAPDERSRARFKWNQLVPELELLEATMKVHALESGKPVPSTLEEMNNTWDLSDILSVFDEASK